ncbi:hypothetical protein DDE19_25825 [Micromonospora ureilytica]|uniref:Uncharacterized protein n=1 Tax=Micromonospora ureilytica TaxID=709868 RepID=A0A3N9XKK2_9ACTN|nr:hypothetical protein DDE19_25825 [Micromonospora ureilytica]
MAQPVAHHDPLGSGRQQPGRRDRHRARRGLPRRAAVPGPPGPRRPARGRLPLPPGPRAGRRRARGLHKRTFIHRGVGDAGCAGLAAVPVRRTPGHVVPHVP